MLREFEVPFEGGWLHLWCRGPVSAPPVLYVHGATFPSALSIGYRLDGFPWADDLIARGFQVWGFDLLGYGRSSRPRAMAAPAADNPPIGGVESATRQIHAVLDAMREADARSDARLIAHSWGCVPALRVAACGRVHRIALFGPIARREGVAAPMTCGAWRHITIADQHRRFAEDVPVGEGQLLSDRHFALWGADYLASDPDAASRAPPAVRVPAGPSADIAALWSGAALYDPSRVNCPASIVRGEWDSLATDADATRLYAELGAAVKWDVKIARATHLAHLEAGRFELYAAVGAFLENQGATR